MVSVRHQNEFTLVNNDQIDFMDVSPQQVVSVAAVIDSFP